MHGIKGRLKRLETAAARRRADLAELRRLIDSVPLDADGKYAPETEEHEATLTRLRIMIAGLPPVHSLDELSLEQVNKYCEYWHIDPTGETLELPQFSWKVREDNLQECWTLYGKRNRGEITPEEYRRRIHELTGVPLPEGSSSGDSGELQGNV